MSKLHPKGTKSEICVFVIEGIIVCTYRWCNGVYAACNFIYGQCIVGNSICRGKECVTVSTENVITLMEGVIAFIEGIYTYSQGVIVFRDIQRTRNSGSRGCACTYRKGDCIHRGYAYNYRGCNYMMNLYS